MNFFTLLTQQLGNLFRSQSAGRAVALLALMGVSMGGLGYLVLRARTGNYKTVYSGMTITEAAQAAAKLERLGIDTRLLENGTGIQAPARQWDRALMILAEDGLPGGTIGYEAMDRPSIGMSDYEQKMRGRRALEGELSRSIMSAICCCSSPIILSCASIISHLLMVSRLPLTTR